MITMNSYIDQVVTEAELFDGDIEALFFEVAMEEEVAKDVTQASKDEPGLVDKMIKTVKEIIARINGMIQKNFLKFKNFITKAMQTDQGFENEFRKAFKSKQPLEAIKLISYEYNPGVLDAELVKVNKAVQKLLAGMSNKVSYTALSDVNTANDMDRTPDEIYEIIFKDLNCPSDVRDINTYFLHIKGKYRGEKKEMLFKSSQTTEYRNITKGHKHLMDAINNSQSTISNQVATLKSNLHNTIQNRQAAPEVKKRAVKQCKNLSHVMNFYIRFIDIYMQLQLERLFTYRTVLKRLYDFQ